MFCPKCRMANADTRVSCTKCGAKLPVVPGATDRASPDATAKKMADEWGSGLSLTAAVAAATKMAHEPSAEEGVDLSAQAMSLGIAPDPVLTTAPPRPEVVAAPDRKPNVPTSRNAKLSFVLGLFSLIPPVAVYAIRYGYKGRRDARESNGNIAGRGLATTGLVLGWAGIILFTCVFGLTLYAHNHVNAKAVNESNAVGYLRTVSTALVGYASTYQNGFPSTLNPLVEPAGIPADCNHAGLLSQNLDPYKGYAFLYKPIYPDNQRAPAISPKAAAANCISGGASGYTLNADPVAAGQTGLRHFYIDQTGIIRYSNDDKPADENSPSLQ
jgi:hypothetical protein